MLSGTYAYHATNTAPATCDPNSTNSGDGIVLSRDYKESFRADSFPSYQYAAKYFPFLGGPQTNAQGQKAHLIRTGQISETYRTFNVDFASGTCTSQDQSCSKATSLKTARFLFGVTHKNFRPNGPLQTTWKFARKRATFTVHGSAAVKNTRGYNATVTYSAKATLKKVVIPDGCADTHPQHTFVCSK